MILILISEHDKSIFVLNHNRTNRTVKRRPVLFMCRLWVCVGDWKLVSGEGGFSSNVDI